MPGRDGRGPMGEGMLTGRGMGPCSGYESYGSPRRRPFGRFGGYGRGGGPRGFWSGPARPRFGGPADWTEDRRQALEDQKEYLQSRLDQINEELEK